MVNTVVAFLFLYFIIFVIHLGTLYGVYESEKKSDDWFFAHCFFWPITDVKYLIKLIVFLLKQL